MSLGNRPRARRAAAKHAPLNDVSKWEPSCCDGRRTISTFSLTEASALAETLRTRLAEVERSSTSLRAAPLSRSRSPNSLAEETPLRSRPAQAVPVSGRWDERGSCPTQPTQWQAGAVFVREFDWPPFVRLGNLPLRLDVHHARDAGHQHDRSRDDE
jgi:hypothetical protein